MHALFGVIHGGVDLLKQFLIGTAVLRKISDTNAERDALCKGKLPLFILPAVSYTHLTLPTKLEV